MPTEEEIRQFAHFNKYGKMPNKPKEKVKSKIGRLKYNNEVLFTGDFRLCHYKKQEYIQKGYNKNLFKITY